MGNGMIQPNVTPNMGVSQTPNEFSKTMEPNSLPQQSPTVLKITTIASDGTDLKNVKQMSSGEDLGTVNTPQNIMFARNVEQIDKDRSVNNETPNISNPHLNIGPRYNEMSQTNMINASEGNYKPSTIYQYDGYDS